MAPRGPAKARDYDYSNVGKAGRRTGITLKEGKRDEHGMEEIEGMFSSPEKSPANENGFDNNGNETVIGSDGMSIDEGNAPGPADFLNGRRASYFPPPVARSPMKTGLTGSPRRTPGLRSSVSPQRDQPSSSPSDGKYLGNAKGDSRQDASPLTHRSVNAPSVNHANGVRNKGKGNNKAVEPAPAVDFSDDDANSQLNGDENADSYEQTGPGYDDSFAAGDDTILSDQAPQPADDPDRDGADQDSPSAMGPESRQAEPPKPAAKTKRSAPGDTKRQVTTEQDGSNEQELAPKRKRPGRPPRKINEEAQEKRPSKKAKTSADQTARPKESGDPQLDQFVENYASNAKPLKGRSLYILKREVPSENSTRTRSGRNVVRPLAYWRNERCVYGNGEATEGERFPVSTLMEVQRTDELEPEYKKSKTNKRRTSKKSKKNKDAESDNEEEDADLDPWEKEGGVLHGYIRKWNPGAQVGVNDDEVLDIAYAPSGIETRDVKDSTFRFAKLLSSPFIGSGIVELPPGGVKKPKNSKKMHMVFYVCHGRVQIDISGVQFSAGKGCVFQVPRGNYYSFANTHGFDTRLFFTQGCVPMESEVENEAPAPDATPKPAALEEDSAVDTGRPTTKGRPKGSKGGAKGPKGTKGVKGTKGAKGKQEETGSGSNDS